MFLSWHSLLLGLGLGWYAGSRSMGPVMQRGPPRPWPSSLPGTLITGFSHWPHTVKLGELRLFHCTPSAAAWPGP